MDSRQIRYLPVYELVADRLGDPGLIPGTPAWCQLDAADPAKWRALLWPTVWWCLAEDSRQTALAEASHEIGSAADWTAISRNMLQRNNIYIPRKAS
jgi:Protein of unknown function (DUF2742)